MGVLNDIHEPPVDNVGCAAVQILSTPGMKAASSRINNDKPSERAASSVEVSATICEPLAYSSDSLLSVTHFDFNQVGRLACITRTFVTRLRALDCFVAITKTFLSLWNVIIHRAYPATRVEIPNWRPFRIILYW